MPCKTQFRRLKTRRIRDGLVRIYFECRTTGRRFAIHQEVARV